MGRFEALSLDKVERSLRYHPSYILPLTCSVNPLDGQCLVGSLTGAVAS